MCERDTLGVLRMTCALLFFATGSVAAQSPEPRPAPAPPQASQPPSVPKTYSPITSNQRIVWIAESIAGTSSLRIGMVSSIWQTAFNSPDEWHRTVPGFTKRYLQREADVAISSGIEAGIGAIWGEDPRYIPSRLRGFWPRTRYAMKTVFMGPRGDGRLAPAWGRVAGNIANNVIENTWLPPSVSTPGQTTIRSVEGFAGRLVSNFWGEFGPDVKRRFPGAHVLGWRDSRLALSAAGW